MGSTLVYDEKFSANPNYITQLGEDRQKAIRAPYCHLNKPNQTFEEYQLGINQCLSIKKDQINVLIIGDSHAADLYAALAGTHIGFNFLQATGAGCTANLDDSKSRCKQLLDYGIKFAQNNKIEAIIFAGRWPNGFEGITNEINELKRSTNKIFLVGPPLEYTEYVYKFIARREKEKPIDEYSKKFINSEKIELNEKMKNFADANGVYYIDRIGVFCNGKNTCPLISSAGDLFIMDYGHLSRTGAIYLGERLLAKQSITRFLQVKPTLLPGQSRLN